MRKFLERTPAIAWLIATEAIITYILLETREFIIAQILFTLLFFLYDCSSSQRNTLVDRFQSCMSFLQDKYQSFVGFGLMEKLPPSLKIHEPIRYLLTILTLTFTYIYGWFAVLFVSVFICIAFEEQCKSFIFSFSSQTNIWGKKIISDLSERASGFKEHCGWDSNSASFDSYFEMVQQIPSYFTFKETITFGCIIFLISLVFISMSLLFWIVLGGGFYSLRVYKINKERIDERVRRVETVILNRIDERTITKEQLFTCLNKFEINPNGKSFINNFSSNPEEGCPLTEQAATAYGLKVIMEIESKTPQDIELKKAPTKVQYTGSYIEINPERIVSTEECSLKEFVKLEVEKESGSSPSYFNPHSFNYIELTKGSITKECPISSKVQTFKKVNFLIESKKQEVEKKIQTIQQTHRQIKEKELIKFNKIGHSHELTKAQREDDLVLTSKLTDILRSMNFFVELDPETITKDYKSQGSYKIIHSNYRIETSSELRIIIRISGKNNEYYYFSNPEWLPIFFEEVPLVIENYVKKKNSELTEERMKKVNEYSESYILADKETVESTKVFIIDKIEDTSQKIKDFPRTLSESGFKFENSLNQDYHVIWIISYSTQKLTTSQMNFIKQQYYKGAGLFIWADNAPLFVDANRILRELGFSFYLQGNYRGQKILQASDQLKQQTFDLNHPVSSGFKTLYEGYTICYPNKVTDGFQVFAYNSNPSVLQPASIYKKATTKTGGIWIDTAYTKLWPQFHKSNRNEVIRYFTNASLYIRKKEYLT